MTLPVYTQSQIASYLTDGYWLATGGSRHSFATATITYNIENLTPSGQSLAIAALSSWAGATGLTFQRTGSVAQITFDDASSGAYATYTTSGNLTTSSRINVGTDWLSSYGTAIGGYAFQTYIHEIGHALGLGHAGNYNGSASWNAVGGGGNHFLNDSWQATVMSYFDQDQNTYVNATEAFIVGPMIADIVAIQSLYGVPANVRTGNTTYGFNSTSDATHNFANYAQFSMVAFSIFDSGGTDTLDTSGFSATQLINLTPGAYSDIGGEVGNIGIAVNTFIENARGGSGNDVIIANLAGNELWGNGGNDTIYAGPSDDLLIGGAGADTLNGGVGFDYADYSTAPGGVMADLSNVDPNAGDALGDLFVGVEALFGSVYGDVLRGDSGNNTISGRSGDDLLIGGMGDDFLGGGGGNDTLFGGPGQDLLFGREDNDILNGAKGNDQLTGGPGNDTFIFTVGGMADVINDFVAGPGVGDVLQIGMGAAFNTFAEIIAVSSELLGSVAIDFGGGDSITLLNATIASLATDDFIFI